MSLSRYPDRVKRPPWGPMVHVVGETVRLQDGP